MNVKEKKDESRGRGSSISASDQMGAPQLIVRKGKLEELGRPRPESENTQALTNFTAKQIDDMQQIRQSVQQKRCCILSENCPKLGMQFAWAMRVIVGNCCLLGACVAPPRHLVMHLDLLTLGCLGQMLPGNPLTIRHVLI